MYVIDFIGTIVLTAVVVVNVNAVIGAMRIPRAARFGLATGIGLWMGVQVALAGAGAYGTPVPYIGIAVVLPLIAAAIATRWMPKVRAALLSVPTPLLVGLNASRVLGAFFLILAADGRLGGPFPQSAGWGDIITGLLAIPLAIAIIRGRAGRRAILGWNLFGALDLIVAVALGVLSGPGSPIQMIDTGAGSSAIAALPWVLIPTVLVPFYLITHGIIFLQLRRAPVGSRPQKA
jgi:hypothetical protein